MRHLGVLPVDHDRGATASARSWTRQHNLEADDEDDSRLDCGGSYEKSVGIQRIRVPLPGL